jgi:hypothetical protein
MLLKITFNLKCLVAVSESRKYVATFRKVLPHSSNVGQKNKDLSGFSQNIKMKEDD